MIANTNDLKNLQQSNNVGDTVVVDMSPMTAERRGILINSIISYLKEQVVQKNKKLASENLHYKQEIFDSGDMFLQLAFMDDEEIEKIASQIL